jgi:hypothetical protein
VRASCSPSFARVPAPPCLLASLQDPGRPPSKASASGSASTLLHLLQIVISVIGRHTARGPAVPRGARGEALSRALHQDRHAGPFFSKFDLTVLTADFEDLFAEDEGSHYVSLGSDSLPPPRFLMSYLFFSSYEVAPHEK